MASPNTLLIRTPKRRGTELIPTAPTKATKPTFIRTAQAGDVLKSRDNKQYIYTPSGAIRLVKH